MKNWGQILGDKRVIFTVTTGRSGTHYLARILSYLPGTSVYHEEREHCYEHHLRATQDNPAIALSFMNEEKLPFIERSECSVFIECSHLFCKGFFDSLLQLGVVPDLILLRRDNRAIAKSLFQLNTIPGRTNMGLKFYLAPFDRDVRQLPDWAKYSDYQLCYWYCLEIERRRILYASVVRENGARVSDVSLDEINTISGYRKLMKDLQLSSPNAINWLKFVKNKKNKAGDFSTHKSGKGLPCNVDEQEQEMEILFR